MPLVGMSPIPPSPLPSPTPSIRVSKIELLSRLLERQQTATSTPTALHSHEPSSTNMGAIIGGIVAALVVVGLVVVAIIVPLQRRRRLESQQRVNLDPPFRKSKPNPVNTIDKTYRKTTEKGHNPSNSGVPLLQRTVGPSSPKTTSAFSDIPLRVSLPQPESLHHPSFSSTHLYQFPQPPNQQQKHDDLYFHYQTASTAATGPLSEFVNGNKEAGQRAVSEFDPYSSFVDIPSPLESRKDSGGFNVGSTGLERPSKALTPSSPNKITRDLPLNVSGNLAGVGASGSLGNPFSGEDTNPFMAPSETFDHANSETANAAQPTSNRSASPQRPEFFSYHSTRRSKAPASIPEFPPPPAVPTEDAPSQQPVVESPSTTNTTTPSRQPIPRSSSPPSPPSPTDSVSSDSASLYSQMSLSRATTRTMGSLRYIPGTSSSSSSIRTAGRRKTNGLYIFAGVPEGDVLADIPGPESNGAGAGAGAVKSPSDVDDPTSPSATDLWPSPLAEEVPFLLPFGAYATSASHSASGMHVPYPSLADDDDNEASSSLQPSGAMERMNTYTLGNLIKTRAAARVVVRDDEDVSPIERIGSIREPLPPSEPFAVRVRGRGIGEREVKEVEQAEGGAYGRIVRAPVKRTHSSTGVGIEPRRRSTSRGRLVPKVSVKRKGEGEVEASGGEEMLSSEVGGDGTGTKRKSKAKGVLPEKRGAGADESSRNPSETQQHAEGKSGSSSNPLTGAIGLGKSHSVRSPATPTYHYAFADLEQTKPFLPGTAPLNLATGLRAASGQSK